MTYNKYKRIKTLEYIRLAIALLPSVRLPLILNILGLLDEVEHYDDDAILSMVQKRYFNLKSQIENGKSNKESNRNT